MDELIPFPVYVRLFEEDRFRFRFAENSRCIVVLSKQRSGRLDLALDFNNGLSMNGREIPLLNRKGQVRGGQRSVYDVREPQYRALFEQGLLSKGELRTDIELPAPTISNR